MPDQFLQKSNRILLDTTKTNKYHNQGLSPIAKEKNDDKHTYIYASW